AVNSGIEYCVFNHGTAPPRVADRLLDGSLRRAVLWCRDAVNSPRLATVKSEMNRKRADILVVGPFGGLLRCSSRILHVSAGGESGSGSSRPSAWRGATNPQSPFTMQQAISEAKRQTE